MCKEIDWTHAEEQIENFKNFPSGAMMNADFNELRILACEAGEASYQKLMEKLEGQKELQDLLFASAHLNFVAHEFDRITLSDIDLAKKEIFTALLDDVPEAVSQQIEGIFDRSKAKASDEEETP